MKRRAILSSAAALLLAAFPFPAFGQGQHPVIASTNLKVGDRAPDFTLPSDQHSSVTLSSFRGKKNVILAFYILAFTSG